MKTVLKMLVPFVLQHSNTSSSFLFSSSSSYSLVTQALLKALFTKKAHVFACMLSLLQFQCTYCFFIYLIFPALSQFPFSPFFLPVPSPTSSYLQNTPPSFSSEKDRPLMYISQPWILNCSNLRHTLYNLGQMRQSVREEGPQRQ